MTPRRDPDGWTSEVSSGLALAGFLCLVLVGFTALAAGPFQKFDAYLNIDRPPQAWLPFLFVLDRIGQRAVCLPILAVVAFWLCRRNESWRPLVIAGASVFALNLTVLVLKLALGRGAPQAADPSFFVGGISYPSGHSANIVLVYGLIAYLVSAYYAWVTLRLQVLLWGGVGVLSVLMVVVSVTLNWHWFGDLVAGLLVGGIILQLTATADRMVPAGLFDAGWRRGVREVAAVFLPLTRRP